MQRFIVILVISSLVFSSAVQAQKSSKSSKREIHNQSDTLIFEGEPLDSAALIEMEASRYIPRKAGLYSAVLPGLGQAYNKKYWKMPIIYGGFIGLGFGINFYNNLYNKYRGELFDILESGENRSASNLTEETLRRGIDKYRRERDFMIVLTAVLYFLNIADAHIDAHLKEFDLNEKLKMTVAPTLNQTYYASCQAGLSVTIKF